jgi:pyruvate kinase
MPNLRKTKILATLGPASDQPEIMEQLIQAGADGFRLNFSHGNHDYFRPIVGQIRALAKKHGKAIAILQDLQGPKIRTGVLKDGAAVHLVPGSKFILTTRELVGNDMIVSTTYDGLIHDVRPGDRILIDDGAIELKVLSAQGTDVETEVVIGGYLKEKKGINLPGIKVSAPSLTPKDIEDVRFGVNMDVDYVALSFVRAASDVVRLRQYIKEWNRPEIRIIAKIEKPEAVNHLNEIVDASDGVMVARGDLGVELPAEKIPLIQKMIIEKANKMEKLVITATQMLESMVDHVRPTRAEASDVANAILDGTDVLMLSQETAVGLYPAKAVKTMASIASYTEEDEEVFRFVERIRPEKLVNFTHAIVHSARTAAEVMKASALVVFTQSGLTASLASCQRPQCPIYAFTPFEKTYNELALVWGVYPMMLERVSSTDGMIQKAESILLEKRLLQRGDVVVIVSGAQPIRGGTNMMKIERIGE